MSGDFTLFIDLGNDAFQPEPNPELARLLRVVADRLEVSPQTDRWAPILDLNGNQVGSWSMFNELE